MSKRPGPNKENLEETREAFLKTAIREFVEHGYARASTNRIVESTGMARGSLYYHFGDKQGLFRAVFEHIIAQAFVKIREAADSVSDSWEGIARACEAYLDLCATQEFRKIILIESQAALAFQDRMEIHARTIRTVVQSRLENLAAQGRIEYDAIPSISYFLYGTTGEMGRFLDSSTDIETDKQRHKKIFRDLMKKVAP
jgi:AcrR family transcriptional regulator